MSRIDATLAALKAQGRKALIPYVMAGFPQANITPALMHGMVDAGADIISGGVGNDVLYAANGFGGLGDDTYVVDDNKDVVSEAADEGIDMVQSTALREFVPDHQKQPTKTQQQPW